MKNTNEYLNKYEQHQGCACIAENKTYISIADAKLAMIEMAFDCIDEVHDLALDNWNKFAMVNKIIDLKNNLK
jgi:hypothetical protein